jgi:DNA polymerase-3 subunit delta'
MIKYISKQKLGDKSVRKYFTSLFGNDATKNRLGAAIDGNTLPHALLISGQAGSGKHTLTGEIARALNCENRHDSTAPLPCNRCNNCRRIRENNFTDLKFLSRSSDKATIGVGEVRLFREDMFLTSTESDFKIYVIEDAECLTPEAQNALLKVLEEPPPSVIIIMLVKEGDKILTTVKSRMQFIAMSRFTVEEIDSYLTEKAHQALSVKRSSPDKYKGVLLTSDGRIGEAIRLFEEKNLKAVSEERECVDRIIKSLSSKVPYSSMHSAISSLPQKRAELSLMLETVITAIRDLIASRLSGDYTPLYFSSKEETEKTAREIGIKKLLRFYDEILSAHEACVKNGNVGLILSLLSTKLKSI